MRVILAAAFLVALAGPADAYPQFQLSSGADTCQQCHFSPGGGGLINDYGRDEAGSTLSWREGNGGFAHGAWTPPEWLGLGADLRGVAGARDNTTVVEPLIFPMQADLYVRPKFGPVSVSLTVGARAVREPEDPVDRLASREHYVQYQPEGATWYARAGRFLPVYGIRTQDHTSYVRRWLQMYILEEPYGAAWGRFGERDELHVSAFVRAPEQIGIARDNGVAAYYERRNEASTMAWAAQTKLTVSETDRRAWVGGVYKRWMESPGLMFLAELDAGVQTFVDAPDADPAFQLVSYLGTWYMAKQGLMLGAAVQSYDPDLRLRKDSRAAGELNVQWFPIPHVELHALTRVDAFGVDKVGWLAMLQAHYWL